MSHAGTVLVVDDDHLVRRVLSRVLAQAGFSCHVAGSAAEALARLAKHDDIDVLVSDIRLPDDASLSFLDQLPRSKRVPVVLMTGAPQLETALVALRWGVLDYLVKPVETAQLLTVLARGVAWRRAVTAVTEAKRLTSECRSQLNVAETALLSGIRVPITDTPVSNTPLTRTEEDILHRLLLDHVVDEIADQMGRSKSTIRNHLQSIFRKYGVSSRKQLLEMFR